MTDPWKLPLGWNWAAFGDVARVAARLVDPALHQELPHVAPNHIESGTGRLLPHGTVAHDGVTSAKHRFFQGQLLYSKIRPYLAKVVFADFEGLCSADMYPIETSLEPRYLKWWMLTDEFTRLAAGEQARTVLPKINKASLVRLPVPVPKLAEQRRIVEILEDHLSRLDAAAEQLRLARGRVASLEQQTFRHELTGGLLAKVPSSLPTSGCDDGSLPDLPEGWAWRRLQDLAEVAGGVTKDAKKQSDVEVPEWPYLRVANVQRGRLDLSLITRIRVLEVKARSLFLEEGDVLLNEGGDRDKLGRGWVWEGQIEQCIHQNHVFRARVVNRVIEPRLLSWAANTFGGPWCESNGKQSTNLASISLSKIRLMPVPVPPCSVQSQLVQRIDERLISCRRLTEGISVAHNKGLSLRKALLEAAFSGRLSQITSFDQIEEMAGV